MGKSKFGYLYAAPKMHKASPAQRFIAAMFNCSLTPCARVLHAALKKVLESLREKDDEHFVCSGIKRFFVVNGYEMVALWLSSYRRTSTSTPMLFTGDFSTMYTSIPHDDLLLKIERVCTEAWSFEAKKMGLEVALCIRSAGSSFASEWVRLSRRGSSWEKGLWKFDVAALMSTVQFVVRNTFVANYGVLRKQIIGIPMGTNPGPDLANLYLYAYESAFVDKLIGMHGIEVAKAFRGSFRLIDDVFSVDNCFSYLFQEHASDGVLGGVYPAALTLNDTTISRGVCDCKIQTSSLLQNKFFAEEFRKLPCFCNREPLRAEVQFLGMVVKDSVIGDTLDTDIFDKRQSFKFKVIRFPHLDSVIPTNIPFGVFKGLLFRTFRICSRSEHFSHHAVVFARILVENGCSRIRLAKVFRSFLCEVRPLRWDCSLSSLCRSFVKALGC
jgi:hypothetical protein